MLTLKTQHLYNVVGFNDYVNYNIMYKDAMISIGIIKSNEF
jgi:hypothetical protein